MRECRGETLSEFRICVRVDVSVSLISIQLFYPFHKVGEVVSLGELSSRETGKYLEAACRRVMVVCFVNF